jgi:hypothetical protein
MSKVYLRRLSEFAHSRFRNLVALLTRPCAAESSSKLGLPIGLRRHARRGLPAPPRIAPRVAASKGYSRSVAVIPMVRGLNVQAFCCGEGGPAGLLPSACPSA